MLNRVEPGAFAGKALQAEGGQLLDDLFGSPDGFAALERQGTAALRHCRAVPLAISSADVWRLIDAQVLDIDNDEVRLVVTGASGFRQLAPDDYALRARGDGAPRPRVPDPGKVRALFCEGATIVLQRLDRRLPGIASLCAGLSARLGHPCQLSVYLTPAGARGLDIHHDTHDVIVVQVEGSKRFQLFETIVERPIPGIYLQAGHIERARPAGMARLEAGDVLYIPRGIPHCAESQDAVSLHATIGVLSITWASLVDALAEELYFIEPLRRACATGEIFDADTLIASARQAAACLAEWIGRYGAERLASLACQAYVRSFAVRPAAHPPAATGTPADAVFAVDPDPLGGARVVFPGGEIRLDREDLLQWLASQHLSQQVSTGNAKAEGGWL